MRKPKPNLLPAKHGPITCPVCNSAQVFIAGVFIRQESQLTRVDGDGISVAAYKDEEGATEEDAQVPLHYVSIQMYCQTRHGFSLFLAIDLDATAPLTAVVEHFSNTIDPYEEMPLG